MTLACVPRVLVVFLALCLSCASSAGEAPRVRVGDVEFSGIATASGGAAFLGLPYAAPPVGDLRWAPTKPWQAGAGSLQATAFASACMQNARMVGWYRDVVRTFDGDPAVVATPRFDEDCLYLNVWTPETLPNKPLPVIVWIHGGSNTGGWSFEPNYHGEALARQGVVVVSIAYRLGVFGFFSLPELAQSNFGLLDQIAALQWIQSHIRGFGGDPARVTVAGESAGASNIASLIASRRARGLFARAVIQSGGYVLQSRATRAQAIPQGLALARAAGAQGDGGALATLRGLGAQQLQDAVDAMKYSDFDPVVDGDTVTEPPRDAIAAGRMNRVDLLAGSNDNEWLMYLDPPLDEAAWLANNAKGGESALRTALAREHDPLRRMDLLETARLFVCPSLWLAGQVHDDGGKAWVYHFTRVREGVGGRRIGAYHGAEIPYVFGTHDAWLPTAAEDRELGARMMRYWSRFAASGDPNGPGDPAWPVFSASAPGVMRLDAAPSTLAVHPSAALCGVLGP